MFKEYSKIMGYTILTIVLLSAVGGVLTAVGVFGERVLIKNSFQYKEGMAQQAAIWESELIGLDIQISEATSQEAQEKLLGQKRFVESRLRAVTLIK